MKKWEGATAWVSHKEMSHINIEITSDHMAVRVENAWDKVGRIRMV